MRVRASTLRRAGLCLILGVITSWLVAWGLVIAAWRGVAAPPLPGGFGGALVTGPYLVERASSADAACALEVWRVSRVEELTVWDGTFWSSLLPGKRAEDLLAECERVAIASGRPWRELDADAFRRSPATTDIGDARASITLVHSIGWPRPTVDQVSVEHSIGHPDTCIPDPPVVSADALFFPLPWIEGLDPVPSFRTGRPEPIRLPCRPNWPGLAVNTAFYGGTFAIPLFGIPALRRTLRARRGRCTRCDYELAGTPGGPCPECGARRVDVSRPTLGASGAIG